MSYVLNQRFENRIYKELYQEKDEQNYKRQFCNFVPSVNSIFKKQFSVKMKRPQ